ncbi:hypothetical protein AB685_10655 [Bacillus sp. LL01]|uniref:hypothetical protein n=1 Tax=Bacillus sp. LL01 TaxID=1665556 RepID=UPI00064CEE45|nr:hypothetical protein [Bacillus sp. LL01]KMJ58351.1 hypothetical protein AB685_10655 [Bacillus sp. LL01]
MKKTVFFSDNFFSSGETEIFNEEEKVVGKLDLRSAFSAAVDVKTPDGNIIVSGAFGFFSSKWFVKDHQDKELGELRQRFAFFKSIYEYNAFGRGIYRLECPAFSREYTLYDENDELAAEFKRTDSFFESVAFQLSDYTSDLEAEELVAIVMGMNAIQKRRRSQNSSAAT